jgi:excinuclease UvrABC nuclease subunit
MHTCSRPCNNDIDRAGYLSDIETAMAFIQGHDAEIESALLDRITELSSEERFEEAEGVRRKLDKVRRARQEVKDTFGSVWSCDFVVVLPADSVSRTKIAFVRAGNIVELKEYEVETLADLLPNDMAQVYSGPLAGTNREWQYDEFCLVSNYVVSPLQSVHLIPVRGTEDMVASVRQKLRSKKKGN